MKKNNFVIGLSIVIGATLFSQANAAEIKVKMLNSGEKGAVMVFEPAYIKANVGDTIKFEPTQVGGHNAKSMVIPKGAAEFNSKADTAFSYKVEKEGVYLYMCEPHKAMGMVGVIQVGKATNLADVKKVADEEGAKLAMNKDAYKNILAKVK